MIVALAAAIAGAIIGAVVGWLIVSDGVAGAVVGSLAGVIYAIIDLPGALKMLLYVRLKHFRHSEISSGKEASTRDN